MSTESPTSLDDEPRPPGERHIGIPELALVVLVGASGSGKSTFAAKHFAPTQVVSSDVCRGLVSDDPNDQSVTGFAFDLLHEIVAKRLEIGRLTVVDATNVQSHARASLIELAKRYHVFAVAIVFDLPRSLCEQRNTTRPDRDFGPHVVRQQHQQLRRSMRGLQREGFRRVFTLKTPTEVDTVSIGRDRLWTNRSDEHGPFDIIGDVHGCHDELLALLGELGYPIDQVGVVGRHRESRRVVLLGDLVDRGPKIAAVLRTAMQMTADGVALCIPGNHENKLGRALAGRNVQITHGLAESLEQIDREPAGFRDEVRAFIDGLVSHFVLDDGNLVVAHAGLKQAMQGRSSGAVRSFALYGETTGETDEFGLPVRYEWADDYRGKALVVYGHTPVGQAAFNNNTICVDTGCVFGGSLTALRYPERAMVSVPAAQQYYEPIRPLVAKHGGADASPHGDGVVPPEPVDDREPALLDIDDVLGKRIVSVSLLPSVTVREENAVAALEVMSRFAIDPRWLVYLPPTMAPTATSSEASVLEHPREAFADFRSDGVATVVCEEKHMGSRAVFVLCRDEAAMRRRFLVAESASLGACFTRTGRAFFTDAQTEVAVLQRLRQAVDAAGWWHELGTDWLVLDTEVLPWSFKAGDLLRRQYAAVGASSRAATSAALAALTSARDRGVDLGDLPARLQSGHDASRLFVDAYRRYCWSVSPIDELQVAPFQILAAEGEVLARRDHRWHLEMIDRLAGAEPGLVRATPSKIVELAGLQDGANASEADAIEWWQELTDAGGEGMVVKPAAAIVEHKGRIVQPGIKCRGSEYLRIIYGPDYLAPAHLARLRQRRLGHKRSLALREFALGIEALDRFVNNEPLYRVHECVFGVLALESEPVDPRL